MSSNQKKTNKKNDQDIAHNFETRLVNNIGSKFIKCKKILVGHENERSKKTNKQTNKHEI